MFAALIGFSYLGSGACGDPKATDVRAPSVAGRFYPAEPEKLRQAIQLFLKDSVRMPIETPVALIVPHAGYIYAGQIYADAYRQVMGRHYDVVAILGVNHTAPGFSGVSLGPYSAYRTPLGDIPVDEEITSRLLSKCRDCNRDRQAQAAEHSIEVQVPFIQVLFPNAKIVPAILHPPDMGMCTRFGQSLAKALKNRQALIIISSDLSHYPDSDNAAKADRETLDSIATLDPLKIVSLMHTLNFPNLDTRACGEASILAGLTAAKALGATQAIAAGYANSGDVAVGDRSRAVGYGAMVLAAGSTATGIQSLDRPAPPSRFTPLQGDEKRELLKLARETIQRYLDTQTVPLARNFPARLNFRQGAFVTLKKNGQLRGCIGHIPPDTELCKAVSAAALLSAFEDTRFLPVAANELGSIEIEISALTPLKPIRSVDEIVVGRDGVLIIKEGSSAIFLPQVAPENNWGRDVMLENLCRKGGWPAGCWKQDAKLQVFQADVFNESQFR
jgi:MEMO1 family protein